MTEGECWSALDGDKSSQADEGCRVSTSHLGDGAKTLFFVWLVFSSELYFGVTEGGVFLSACTKLLVAALCCC
jgi:hypothetical protein